jgi:hypothetical protein
MFGTRLTPAISRTRTTGEGQNTAVISHRLIGRERELLELTTALQQAKRGSGGAIILAGPPGIGKTHLATELASVAQAEGVGVHWGRCWHGDVVPAFWPWTQVLRSMAAEQGDLGLLGAVLELIAPRSSTSTPGEATTLADGFVVLDQLASAVSAAAHTAPAAVVIDDLQWADASSLQAFAHVATTATCCRLLVVATLRSTDEANRAALAELARLAPRVEVAALSVEEVGELVELVLGEEPQEWLLDRVHDACGGNPFYIRAVAETARHGDADAFPASVRGVVLGQLAPLGESTGSLLAVASVLGHEFTTAALAANADADMPTILDAVASAERAGVVRTVSLGTRYAFVHDLVREAIYSALPARDRAAIHRRAATHLTDRGDELQVAARAHHALAALPLGDVADAVALARTAGDRARDQHAFDDAARWYRRAHDAAAADPAIGPRARAELLLAEGAALRSVVSPRAEDVLDEAAVAAHGMGDIELLKRVVVTWAYRHGGAIVFGPRLRPWVERALKAPPGDDVALHARVVGAAAIVASIGDPALAWERLGVAQEMAASAADDRACMDVTTAERTVFWFLAPPDRTWSERARSISDRMEALARQLRDPAALADAACWRLDVALRMGDLSTAEEALILLESVPFGPTVVAAIMGSVYRGSIAGLRADLSAMRAATAPARRLAAAIDVTDAPLAIMDVAHRYVFGRDDPVELQEALAAAASLADGQGPMALGSPLVQSAMAGLAAEAGDVERARELLPLDDSSPLGGGAVIAEFTGAFLAEVAAACALPNLADAIYRWLEPAAGQLMYKGGFWTVFGSADHFLGRCASVLGRVDDAERHFTAALAIEERVGAPHLRARTHLRLAELAVPGHEPRWEHHLEACLALCDQHDFTYLRSCAEALAEYRPQRRRAPSPGRGPNRMTREGDVWAVSFDDRTVRLRDAKGMRLLARLLTDPGHEIHVLELAGAPGLVRGDDGGPVLDAAAKDAYRHRLEDLAEDVEEARRNNDPERVARAEAEIDALTDQLAAAVGVGGRDRRAASQSERARVAATRNLRAAIQRAAEVHPSLGRHLERTIRTGTYCSYQPDPRVPADWTLG